ncbi:gfo/Idh/MocA family oxidoreductase, partial [Clostridioides difficile]
TWTDNWVDLPIDEDLFYEHLQERIAGSTTKKDKAFSGSQPADLSQTFK